MADAHEPVLARAAIDRLAVRPDGRYVDATYGRGGHARRILERLDERGRLWVADRDPEACAHARAALGGDPRVTVVEASFAQLPRVLADAAPARGLDGLLLDLGLSSAQLDAPERGFSFRLDGPLDMRMSRRGPTAADWLARASAREIAAVLRRFGEERRAARIARAIVAARTERPLATTAQLAAVIAAAAPGGGARRHPATRSFQAIRISLNRELEELRALLAAAPGLLAAGARLAVISFHSLEDRLVKRFLRERAAPPAVSRHRPAPDFRPQFEVLPLLRPDAAEVAANPRARSARLRAARRLA